LHGKDVFVNLPTGSGKSLIFQSFPLVVDYLRGNCPKEHSIVVVVSPLVSLMKDQVNYLQSKGMNAAFLGEEQLDESLKEGVEKGQYQIVYGSPETFLAVTRWCKMLSNTVYRRNLCLLAVDEAHCISHWGFSSKKEEIIFRVWFRRINELRSLARRVPVVALKATATSKTREQIMKTLEMENDIHVCEIPDRKNIAYVVEVVGSNPQETFQALIDEVREKGRASPKVIIYCPRIRIVSMIYESFHAVLGFDMYLDSKTCNPRERLVEMYHARVDEENKEQILKSFSELDGCVRVLIATIAYGMGIDCKGVKDVIHYGAPENLERYLQESGRAGRSGENGCKAILLYSNIMLKQCDEEIKSYIRNNSAICRRKLLLSNFDHDLCELDDLDRYNWPHECCDVCQNKCKLNVKEMSANSNILLRNLLEYCL
jgi:RecQ family ATP-dependent DNA helicase